MSFLSTAGRYIAHNPKVIAGVGAGLGAAGNIAHEAMNGQDEKHYIGAGIRGGLAGGLAGASIGGIGRAARDVQLLHPEISGAKNLALGTAKHIGEGVSNFAQRQFHGVTGYGSKDPAYLDRIGLAGRNVSTDKARLMNMRADDIISHNPHRAEKITSGLHKKVTGLHAEGELGQHFRDIGMTSLPGAVKGMATNPREASKAIWNQVRGDHPLAATLGVGLPVAVAARDISRGDESAQGGRTVGEKVMRAGASIGGGLLFSGVPIVPQAVAGGFAEHAAGRLGRAMSAPRQPVASVAG